jgi:hypothetical protein
LKSDPRTQGQLYSKSCYPLLLISAVSLYDAHDISQVNRGIPRSLHFWGICNTNCCHPKHSSTATASRTTN